MTRKETAQLLSVLNAAYPAFYSKFTDKEIGGIVDLWHEMFADEDVGLVKYALKELIATHTGYPPDIAALKAKIKSIVDAATEKPTHEELWFMLKEATKNGYYGAQQEFDKLPPVLKRFCGSPSTLRDYALLDEDIFNTVTRGQFLKQIKVIEAREEYANSMPESIKLLVERVYQPLPGAHPQLTEGEVNDRRNQILDQLDAMKERACY